MRLSLFICGLDVLIVRTVFDLQVTIIATIVDGEVVYKA